MKVLSIFGTRPEAVKMAPVVAELRKHADVESRVLVTAQHRDMLDQVLDIFDIQPDFDLDIMQENQAPIQVAAEVLVRLAPVLRSDRPDWVLVQGDTTTAMAAGLCAFYEKVKVGHVEAGLRTYDRQNPFPEEINRVLADHLADMCFAPTEAARRALLKENVPEAKIVVTGNTVIDALQTIVARIDWPSPQSGIFDGQSGTQATNGGRPPRLPASPEGLSKMLQSSARGAIVPPGKRLVLVTAHRRENFGRPLADICAALKEIAARPDVHLVYPVHPNPNVQQPVYAALGGVPAVSLLPPVDYLEFVSLMSQAHLILTDSGGVQEEAPGLGVPVLVLRAVTERPEAVEAGAAQVVGTHTPDIVAAAARLLDDDAIHAAMARAVNPFGDGRAAGRIVSMLLQ